MLDVGEISFRILSRYDVFPKTLCHFTERQGEGYWLPDIYEWISSKAFFELVEVVFTSNLDMNYCKPTESKPSLSDSSLEAILIIEKASYL